MVALWSIVNQMYHSSVDYYLSQPINSNIMCVMCMVYDQVLLALFDIDETNKYKLISTMHICCTTFNYTVYSIVIIIIIVFRVRP
jgi:hypothetical protein